MHLLCNKMEMDDFYHAVVEAVRVVPHSEGIKITPLHGSQIFVVVSNSKLGETSYVG